MGKKNEKNVLSKLARSLRPQPKSRFLPSQVSLNKDNADLDMYIRHRVNVAYALPRIDNKPPKFPLKVYYNEKKLQEIASRVKSLDSENIEVLQKLNIILRSKSKVDCWNRMVPQYTEKLKERILINKITMHDNKEIINSIKCTVSNYSRAQYFKEWKKNEVIIQKISKYRSPLIDSDATHFSIIKELSRVANPQLRVKCFFDIQLVESKQDFGRIVFELYTDYVPRTCANFQAFCQGSNGISYKGTEFYQILPNYWCQGGDIQKYNGTGGASIYGDTFEDENFSLTHAGRGVISMWSEGKDTNNSKFNITFKKLDTMDGKRVVFGKIICGLTNLQNIEEQGTKSGKALKRVIITNCGVYNQKKLLQQ